MRFLPLLIPSFLLALVWGCATTGGRTAATTNPSDSTGMVESLVRRADAAGDRGEKGRLAEEAVRLADKCLHQSPNDAVCYYYRAMATGFYYEVKVIGYQKGVKQMIEDLNMVISLNPAFDHAGAYRMLGQLFTQLPKTTIHPNDVTRDLDAARSYLSQAIALAPDFPENHLAICQTLSEADAIDDARASCDRAHALAYSWRDTPERKSWLAELTRMKKRLAK